nr:mucin-19-like [Rhipicephalus microplus]
MYCAQIFLAFTIAVVVSGHPNCTNCGSKRCNEFEVAVAQRPRRDRFCRPLFTPTWEMRRLRHCVCKRGYVRNSWGDCIPLTMCRRCKGRPQKDWNLCATACPVACDMPVRTSCSKTCVPGCDCPPGWALDQDNWKRCIKVKSCSPVCPTHSQFEPCVRSCAPKCGITPSKECKTTCYRGECVCDKGFAEFVQYGRKICVLQEQCAWYIRTQFPVTLVKNANTNSGASLGGVANQAQGTTVHPSAITVVPGGTLLQGSLGNLIKINGTTGVGTMLTIAPGVGVVTGSGNVLTQGTPGLHPSVSIENGGTLSTVITNRPAATSAISGSAVSTAGSFPLSSTGNVGFGLNLRDKLQPASTVNIAVSSGAGTLTTATTVSPGTSHVGGGIPGMTSFPDAYRKLIVGTDNAPLSVPVVNASDIREILLSTLPMHSSRLAGTPTNARSSGSEALDGSLNSNIHSVRSTSTALSGVVHSPATASTLGMPSTFTQPYNRPNDVSFSGVRHPGTSVTTNSVNTVPTTHGVTVIVHGTGNNFKPNSGISSTLSATTSSNVEINTIGAQPSLVLQSLGGSAAPHNASHFGGASTTASSISAHATPQGDLTRGMTNKEGNSLPAGGTHSSDLITPNSLGEPVVITPGVKPNSGTMTLSVIPSADTIRNTLTNVGSGTNSNNVERSGINGFAAQSAGVPTGGTTVIAVSNGYRTVVSSSPSGNVAQQGGGVAITSSSMGNVPGPINLSTGPLTAHLSVQGSTAPGLSAGRKPVHGAANFGISGVNSAVPHFPGTAGYNKLLFRSHLRSTQTIGSIVSGHSVLKKFAEFQRLYPEGVDLGDIQPELKSQVEVLRRRGALRDES